MSPKAVSKDRSQSALSWFIRCSYRLNWLVERLCAALVGLMVLIVWFGIVNRYFLETGVTWTEEASRYLMIWSALLAISCCARYREHIGFDMLFSLFPKRLQAIVRWTLDGLAIAFFLYLTLYGLSMTNAGAHQYATIFNMTMMLPFAAVPVSACLTVIQILASALSASAAGLALEDHSAINNQEGVS